jgi:hypothetical protein
VTGEYPFTSGLLQDDAGVWQVDELPLPSPQKLNPRVDAQLSALLVRMLSVSPEARGTARALAEALEAAAEREEKEEAGSRRGTERSGCERLASPMLPSGHGSWKIPKKDNFNISWDFVEVPPSSRRQCTATGENP